MSMLTPDWLAALAARAADPRFAAARTALNEQAARYRAMLPALPERQAGYYHDFFCPQHAVQLRFDPQRPHEHTCPVDGTVFSGEPFDSAWRWSVNDQLSDAALRFALHARLAGGATPDEARGTAGDQEQARRILLGYAARYRTMPPAPVIHPSHPGVVAWSGLDESIWIIRLAWAYALLGEILAENDALAIREDLLHPAAEHLRRVRWPEIHNVTNWNNAALVTLALALGDDPLLGEALSGPFGVVAQLAEGVRDDGFWWEGSLSYHYYTLAALIWTARALRASGRPFVGDEIVRQMFRAPLAIAFPDLTLPAIHDCWYHIGLLGEVGHGIPDAAGFYEVACGWYGDPAFAWVLRQNHARRPRAAIEALLDGVAALPDAPAPTFASAHAAGSGLAVLRSAAPRDRQSYLLLKAGPEARDHGHPDQLSVQFFAHGARLSADLGTPGYGIALNDTWYRQTASHCTVLLDGVSQPPAAARITRYRAAGDFALAEGEIAWAEGPYAGARFRRTILWRDAYWIDIFRVVCPTPRQIDWIWQHLGEPTAVPPSQAVDGGLAGGAGYAHFTGVGRLRGDGARRLRWRSDRAQLDLYLSAADGEQFVATAPANPASQQLAALVRRRIAAETVFLAVLAPAVAAAGPVVHGVRWGAGAPARALTVATTTGREHWQIDPEAGEATLRLVPGAQTIDRRRSSAAPTRPAARQSASPARSPSRRC